MLEKLMKRFNQKEETRRSALKPDEPAKKRTMGPDLKTWMSEAEEAGLEGEEGTKEIEYLAADLHKQAQKREEAPAVERPAHPHLELVVDNTHIEPESGAEAVEEVLEMPAANAEMEAGLLARLELAEGKVEAASAQLALAQAEIERIRAELEGLKQARKKVASA